MPGKRAAKPQPEPEPEDEKYPCADMTLAELAAYVAANPFAHLTHADIRRLFNFGQKMMTAIVAKHPPSISRKINPRHFQTWLWEHREELEKLVA